MLGIQAKGFLAGAAALVTVLVGVGGIIFTVLEDREAKVSAARSARHDIVESVLTMAQDDREAGVGRQREISLLARDADMLIREFGQRRLHLSAEAYVQIAEHVAFSTTDLDLAEAMLARALRIAKPDDPASIAAHRVRGDIAAQRQDSDGMERAYEAALALSDTYGAQDPVGYQATSYTRAYRLLSAYLGANRASSATQRDRFCTLVQKWHSDLALVSAWAKRPLISRQFPRVGVSTVVELQAVCT